MRRKKYSCPNGCKLPPRRKTLIYNKNNTYSFGYHDFPFCPMCGSLMSYSLKKIDRFFDVYNLHPALNSCLELLKKSEYESAVREALIILETTIKDKSGLDSHGFDLMTKALKFEVDKKTGQVTKYPLIAINDLKTESDRNEQDGIRYMLMGFFQGPRNLYLHNQIGSGVDNSISIIIQTSFFLKLLDGHSITKNGHWVKTKVDYNEILRKTPRGIDRIRIVRMLKRREKMIKKQSKN